MIKFIKKYIPSELKLQIKSLFQKHNINGDLNSNRNKIYVVLAADYGNLGDIAISYAQYKYLSVEFPCFDIIDVPISRTHRNIREVKKIITNRDVITIIGGGNFTNKYQSIEDLRLKWIDTFKGNKIICFPQTIDFTDSTDGKKSLSKSIKVIHSHENIALYARESISFVKMREVLKSKVFLCPDIVLSLNESASTKIVRKGVLSCIREDDESIYDESERKKLLDLLKIEFGNDILFSDTHINRNDLDFSTRKIELNRIWELFRKHKVVITDRLHGMIFSVITNTPCVVISNNNHKIKQTYIDWLSSLNYIKFIECNDDIIDAVKSMSQLENIDNVPDFSQKFNCIKDELL